MAAWLPFDEAGIWGGFVGCMVGGWIGAVPMALDWDRDWQVWPVPVLTGAYLAWGVGRALTADLKLGIGRRIDMSVESDQMDKSDVSGLAGAKKKQ
jgi:phosphatidylinositol glycan class F